MSGWFRVSREVFEHPLLEGGEMSRREAWLWLIAKAAWKDTQHRVAGEVKDCPRGSLFVTVRQLQVAWGWASDQRVRKFLKALCDGCMIVVKTDAKKTQITICNYSEYQDVERKPDANRTQTGRKPDALKEEDNKKQDIDISAQARPAPEVKKPFNGKAALLELGCEEKHIDGWLAVRKAKRAPLTEAALDDLKREAAKASISVAYAVQLCAAKGWQGFNAGWNFDRPSQPTDPPRAVVPSVWIEHGSPEWRAWADEYRRTGKPKPIAMGGRQNGQFYGGYFPSRMPPETLVEISAKAS